MMRVGAVLGDEFVRSARPVDVAIAVPHATSIANENIGSRSSVRT